MRLFILLIILMLVICSCAIHSHFPFICFRAGCVKNQFGMGGLKKRIKGKMFVMKMKRSKKETAGSKQKYRADLTAKQKHEKDSVTVIRGQNIDYYKYLLLFKSQRDTSRLDSIVVEHTSQYRNITYLDQERLNVMLDSVIPKKIINIYIRPYFSKSRLSKEQPALERQRTMAISKYLHRAGIAPKRIKVQEQN